MRWYTESGLVRFVENKEKEDEGIKTDTRGVNHGKQSKQAQKQFKYLGGMDNGYGILTYRL